MTISRQVGTLQECYPVFIQDATVSTGLGLPNLTISTFSSYYYRSDMTSTSSVTLVSTGTLGTWSSGQFLQINSTFMRGWYQFCLPNGIFAAGSTCAIHLYGHPSMAPAPILIDITRFNNQGWVSSQPHNITRAYSDVLLTSAAGVLTVDVSTILRSIPVTSFAGVLTANVSTIHGSRAITSAAGVLAVDVSSIQRGSAATSAAGILSVYVSTIITSFAGVQTVNVSTIHGSRAVTTAAGILLAGPVGVSSVTDKEGYSVTSMNVGVNVTSVRGTTAVTTVACYFPTHLDFELTRNVNSTVAFSSVSWSTQSVSVGSVDVTSFYGSGLVTTAAGRLAVGRVGVSSMDIGVSVTTMGTGVGVTTMGIGVGVTTLSVPVDVTSFYGSAPITSAAGILASHVTSMRIAVDRQIADGLLGRNIAGGSDGGRTLTEAVYVLRNRTEISAGVLTVYGTDDATSSWEANVTTTAGNPISQIDPS